jgi:hypothetical protein
MGIGTGLVMSPMTTAVMSTVPPARAGMASATLNTTRQVGGVFGIALLGSIVTGRFVAELTRALAALNLPPFVAQTVAQVARQGRGSAGTGLPSLPGVDVEGIRQAVRLSFTTGMHRALLFSGLVVLAGAIAAAIMVRGTSPQAQMARHAAAQKREAAAQRAETDTQTA